MIRNIINRCFSISKSPVEYNFDALVIGAEKTSSILDFEDRTTCVLFGDGAGAVLIEPSKNDFGWEDEFLRSDGVGAEWLKIKAGGSLYPTSKETFEKKLRSEKNKAVSLKKIVESYFCLFANCLILETADYS